MNIEFRDLYKLYFKGLIPIRKEMEQNAQKGCKDEHYPYMYVGGT